MIVHFTFKRRWKWLRLDITKEFDIIKLILINDSSRLTGLCQKIVHKKENRVLDVTRVESENQSFKMKLKRGLTMENDNEFKYTDEFVGKHWFQVSKSNLVNCFEKIIKN
jgi:hypothetical protein